MTDVQYRHPFDNPDTADGFGSMIGRTSPHRGLDYAQPIGTPIPSCADGVIVRKAYSSVLGYYIVVGHADGMYTGYCHSGTMSTLAVGDTVTRGQTILFIGNTGQSTGPHLHLTLSTEVDGVTGGQVQDPYPYIQARLGAVAPPPTEPVASNAWTTIPALRPSVTLSAASGKIRISISAYGRGALVTYSIAGVRAREEGGANPTSQILLTSDQYGESTSTRSWVQAVPESREVTVYVECFGRLAGAFVASPTVVAEVVY